MTSSFLPMGTDSMLSPPSIVPLSGDGVGLPHEPMAREGLSPKLDSMDPALGTQNLSSPQGLLEKPVQTRGPGGL